MTRKTAAINDLSGMGRCSLVADISVLSAMGISVNPVPTAVLTAQTEYTGYYSRDCTADLPHYLSHWSSLHARFDGILTGYLADSSQTSFVRDFLEQFKTGETTLLVDPVMGDDGFTYANFSPDLLRDMKVLAKQADILTPNTTELCLLTGADPAELLSSPAASLLEQIRDRARSLLNKPGKTILVTGLSGELCNHSLSKSPGGHSGKCAGTFRVISSGSNDLQPGNHSADGTQLKIGNLLVNNEGEALYLFPHEKGHFSGTGDLFAAIVLGGRLNGWSWDRTVRTAGNFLSAGVHDSIAAGTSFLDGINYERYLPMLMPDIRSDIR
ncbi:MAG: bifunctional hydroxymethylpyrimidine kinase/phosphomethylpyrimidine kinase [Bilifractor sp.]|nr:bifunctional hydroxymethylpyrimidine kinase/phosphomethylpyrimidine kinase [Bilifractor sp.]